MVLTAHMLLTTVLRSDILAGMLEKKHTPISHQSSPMRSRSSLSTSHGRLRKYWLAIELHPKTDQMWGNAWSQQPLVYGSPTLAYWASTTAKNIHWLLPIIWTPHCLCNACLLLSWLLFNTNAMLPPSKFQAVALQCPTASFIRMGLKWLLRLQLET